MINKKGQCNDFHSLKMHVALKKYCKGWNKMHSNTNYLQKPDENRPKECSGISRNGTVRHAECVQNGAIHFRGGL